MQVVCVVDDDSSVRKSLANLLKSAGYAPQCFASGEDFLASSAMQIAACVVLDLCMPGLSGHEVQQCLRLMAPELPVVCISANGEAARWRCLTEGAACFLSKPFTGEALLRAIEPLVHRPR
ncbi:response regulator transcription factor [Pseudomonas massiliensis]|uniref:response regulator transcription factor n=1 Tax=Pseudomonas massiliensis TaxID=522492 RepID=UPI00058D9A17|nr:response regulator [Pseudomonas massiliensis]